MSRKVAFLHRTSTGNDCILGTLTIGSTQFSVLERPWRGNKRNVSCIPDGDYQCSFLPRSASGKYRSVYHVRGVRGRSGILIHNGNIVDHTRGCLIIGQKTGFLGGKRAVLASRSALRDLVRLTAKKPFLLVIRGLKEKDKT
jgi:hypothetical protein